MIFQLLIQEEAQYVHAEAPPAAKRVSSVSNKPAERIDLQVSIHSLECVGTIVRLCFYCMMGFERVCASSRNYSDDERSHTPL